jgi:hypothetical protein
MLCKVRYGNCSEKGLDEMREGEGFLLVALLTGYHVAGGWVLDDGSVKDMITAVDLLHAGRLLLEAGIIRGWNDHKGCHWHCYDMMVSAAVVWLISLLSRKGRNRTGKTSSTHHIIYLPVLQITGPHTQRHLSAHYGN